MSIVWKFLTLYCLLEGMNIDYQLNYERAATIWVQQDDKCASIGTHGNSRVRGLL